MKPRFFNYWLAHSCLISVYGSILMSLILLTRLYYNIDIFNLSRIYIILALLLYIPAGLLGFVIGLFPVWAIVGNLVSFIQGAPFQPGDTVCILSGKHKGKITKVYDVWGSRGQVRVILDNETKAMVDDVYCNVAVFKIRSNKTAPPNKLQKDIKLSTYASCIIFASILCLGILKIIQYYLGISEQEFYYKYPFGWYLVIIFGLSFTFSLFYAVKKTMDLHPNIQLRKKSVEELKSVLDDPDYQKWHDEARRLLIRKHALANDDHSLSEKEKLDLINKYFDSFNSSDIDSMVSTVHQDIVVTHFFDRKTPSSTFGSDEFRAYMEKASLEDNKLTQSRKENIKDINPMEDKVIVHTTYEATLAIDFPKGPKKGETLRQNWVIEFIFKDGKIYKITYNKTN